MPTKYFCLFCKKEMEDNGYRFSIYFKKDTHGGYSEYYTIGDILKKYDRGFVYELKEICKPCRDIICSNVKKTIELLEDNENKDLREIYKLECTK